MGRGCAGVVGVFLVFSAVVYVVAFVIAVVAVVLVGAAFLATLIGGFATLWSGISDLRRRRVLADGGDPVQVAGSRAQEIAERSHEAAREALLSTLSMWQQLAKTRGIGTPLQDRFDRLAPRTVGNPAFGDVVREAESAHADAFCAPAGSAADTVRAAARLDGYTVSLREAIYSAARE